LLKTEGGKQKADFETVGGKIYIRKPPDFIQRAFIYAAFVNLLAVFQIPFLINC
jgi:hypothetical protein